MDKLVNEMNKLAVSENQKVKPDQVQKFVNVYRMLYPSQRNFPKFYRQQGFREKKFI